LPDSSQITKGSWSGPILWPAISISGWAGIAPFYPSVAETGVN